MLDDPNSDQLQWAKPRPKVELFMKRTKLSELIKFMKSLTCASVKVRLNEFGSSNTFHPTSDR